MDISWADVLKLSVPVAGTATALIINEFFVRGRERKKARQEKLSAAVRGVVGPLAVAELMVLALLQRSSTTGDDARERRAEARRALNELALALHTWRLFLPGDVWREIDTARRDMVEVLARSVENAAGDEAAALHARVVSTRRSVESRLSELVDMPVVDAAEVETTPPGGTLLPDRTLADVVPPTMKKRARR